jgi:hypothetical protein
VFASWTIPTNTYFPLNAYGTYINFSSEQTFTNAPYIENDYWYFDGYAFQVQNANLTITDFFTTNTNKLDFTISASSGTSTTKIYIYNKGDPEHLRFNSVEYGYGTHWSFDDSNLIVTITWAHSGNVNVEMIWDSSGGGGGGGTGLLKTVLSANLNKKTCKLGESVTVYGTLTKEINDLPLAYYQVRLSTSHGYVAYAQTNDKGNYQFTFTPTHLGSHSIYLCYAGDVAYDASYQTLTFNVYADTPPATIIEFEIPQEWIYAIVIILALFFVAWLISKL